MNILWNPNEAVEILEMPLPLITTGTQDMGDGVYWLKAGTPLDEYFAVANDEDAKYVVAEDFYFISTKPDQAKVVPLITAGYVDINKAEQAAGITYTDACLSALETAGIVMVDGTIAGGGGGGGGVLVVHVDENGSLDKTWQEIKDASATSVVVFSLDGAEFSYLFSCGHTTLGGEKWRVGFFTNGGSEIFVTTDGADSYPSFVE